MASSGMGHWHHNNAYPSAHSDDQFEPPFRDDGFENGIALDFLNDDAFDVGHKYRPPLISAELTKAI